MYDDKPNKTVVNSGIGFCGLLTIVFIVLKLCNVITWSWLWVLAPLWIPAIFWIIVIAVMFIFVWRINK